MISMGCPSREKLSEWCLGLLDDGGAESILNHVERCPACESTVAQLERDSDTLIDILVESVERDSYADEAEFDLGMERIRELKCRSSGETRGPGAASIGAPPPTRVGDYELLEQLGEGAMGTVYKGRHTQRRRVVAVKVLRASRTCHQASLARFAREIEAVERLHHPNIVGASDAGEANSMQYLVMDLVDGADLHRIVKQCGMLQIGDACEIVRQAALGLHHAHEHGLVHRDIKPSNLLITADGRVRVSDLGLALLEDDSRSFDELTNTGQVMGTVDYMAPEQASDSHRVDRRADIYSLGCTLYKLLTGRAPFSGPRYHSAARKLMAHAQATPEPLDRFRDDVPPALIELIEQMMAKRPDERPDTAAQVAQALQRWSGESNVAALVAQVDAGPNHVEPRYERDDSKADVALVSPPLVRPAKQVGTDGPWARSRWWFVACAMLLLVVSAAAAIVIRIKHENGTETIVKVPEGSHVEIDAGVDVEVTLPDANSPPTAKRTPETPPRLVAQELYQLSHATLAGSGYATVSRDGRLVATSSVDGTIRIWDADSGRPRCEISTDEIAADLPFLPLVFSPDASQLVSGGNRISVWDTRSGDQLRRIVEPEIRCLAISPDGKRLAAGSDRSIHIFDFAIGKKLQVIKQAEPVYGLFFRDNTSLAAVTRSGGLKIVTGDRNRNANRPARVDSDGDANHVDETGGRNGVQDRATNGLEKRTSRFEDWNVPRQGSPYLDRGRITVSVGGSANSQTTDGIFARKRMRLVDADSGDVLCELKVDAAGPIAISNDRRLLAVCGSDGKTRLFRLSSPEYVTDKADIASARASSSQASEIPQASASEAALQLWQLLRYADAVVVGKVSSDDGKVKIVVREALKGKADGAIEIAAGDSSRPQLITAPPPLQDGSEGIFFLQVKKGQYRPFSSQCFKTLDHRRDLDRFIPLEKDPGPLLKADADSPDLILFLFDLFLPARERDERELRHESAPLEPKQQVGSVSYGEAVEYLRRQLKSLNQDVVRASLVAVGELHAGQAVPDVVELFQNIRLDADNQDLFTKVSAAKCLYQLEDKRASDALSKTLDAYDPSRKDEFTYRSLMESCIYALGSSAREDAVPALKRAYDRGLATAALQLAVYGDESCFEYLLLNLERGEFADPYFHALRTELKLEPWMQRVIVPNAERPEFGRRWRKWYEQHKPEFKYVRTYEEVQHRLYKEQFQNGPGQPSGREDVGKIKSAVEQLRGDDAFSRIKAVHRLIEIGDPAVEPLRQVLDTYRDEPETMDTVTHVIHILEGLSPPAKGQGLSIRAGPAQPAFGADEPLAFIVVYKNETDDVLLVGQLDFDPRGLLLENQKDGGKWRIRLGSAEPPAIPADGGDKRVDIGLGPGNTQIESASSRDYSRFGGFRFFHSGEETPQGRGRERLPPGRYQAAWEHRVGATKDFPVPSSDWPVRYLTGTIKGAPFEFEVLATEVPEGGDATPAGEQEGAAKEAEPLNAAAEVKLLTAQLGDAAKRDQAVERLLELGKPAIEPLQQAQHVYRNDPKMLQTLSRVLNLLEGMAPAEVIEYAKQVALPTAKARLASAGKDVEKSRRGTTVYRLDFELSDPRVPSPRATLNLTYDESRRAIVENSTRFNLEFKTAPKTIDAAVAMAKRFIKWGEDGEAASTTLRGETWTVLLERVRPNTPASPSAEVVISVEAGYVQVRQIPGE